MTKIYIYCIFDSEGALHGVYSSLKSAHKDAVRLANKHGSGVYLNHGGRSMQPDLTYIRNIFKGSIDIKIHYFSNKSKITILKTKLRE